MSVFNTKVDAYITKAEDFAKPILTHWRQMIHDICPDVEEAIKWGIPHFDYKGEMMCMLAAYKHHCSFSFWKAELMSHPKLKENAQLKPTKRYMGEIRSLADLPPDAELIALIKEAMALNENGIKLVKPVSDKPKVTETPDYFTEKLATNPTAEAIFESKSTSFRKDYIIWITDAKTEATRQSRMEQSLEWIAEGKGRFWKYEK
jgi:uncharacterized protein YdeI (YjbR/CyaY-like superfamily)